MQTNRKVDPDAAFKVSGNFEHFQNDFNQQREYTRNQQGNHCHYSFRKEDICMLQPFRCARSSAHELETSMSVLYAACTLLFFCFLCLTRTGHPELPQISTAASSAGLHTGQAAGREHAASPPSLLYMRASN